jgi:hypothetical protein
VATQFTKERKDVTKGLLRRCSTLPLNVGMILTSMDPRVAYVLDVIKIRMRKDRELTPATIGNEESPDQGTTILDRLAIHTRSQNSTGFTLNHAGNGFSSYCNISYYEDKNRNERNNP